MASMSLQAAYDQARQWLESNDLERAIGLAQHILERYPENLEAYRILGEAYLANRQLDRAQEAFERVLRSDPENIPAHVGLGITYERQGRLDRAIAEFEQALEIKPDMPELRNQLLRLYTDAWGSEHAQLRLSRAGLARLYAKGHMLPQAIAEFRQVIADQPDRFDAMVALAEALWRDGQEDEAIATCRQILARRPESLKANLILGYLEMASGQPEGERFWQAARQMDPYQVVARAMFESLPPDGTGEPTIEEWDEAAWRWRQLEAEQEHVPSTRPMEAVTPVATPTAETLVGSRQDQQLPRRVPASAAAMADNDDFLAGLLALTTPASSSQPAPAPGAPEPAAEPEPDLGMAPFSLEDLDRQAAPPPSAAPAETPEEEPTMTPFSLADLGLTEEEIAGLESLESVAGPPSEPARADAAPAETEDDLGMKPFSLADLGLTEEEIAGLESLREEPTDQAQPGPPITPARSEAPPIEPASAGHEADLEPGDLPLDLQPFSLDELDLGSEGREEADVGGLPPSLQPFSLDEEPLQPRGPGFRAEEGFESTTEEESYLPETGGFSWQQPTQKPEPGFLAATREEPPPSEEGSIFAKLKQRRQAEAASPPPEPLPPVSIDEDEHLGLFSLDDVSLRDEGEAEEVDVPPQQLSAAPPPPTPPALEEIENLQEAIESGQVQPFSLADLGLSEEEIAALGMSEAAPAAAPEALEAPPSDHTAAPDEAPAESPALETPVAQLPPEPTPPEPVAEEAAPEETPQFVSDLKPFSLADLGLTEEEIAALGLGPSAEPEEPVVSELGLTEEEIEGLDLPSWGQAPPTAQPAPAPEAPQTISGDLVVDRLIALGRQQGYVDISDIIAEVQDPEAEAERIEEIGRRLHEANIEIRDGDEIIDMEAEYAEEALPATEEPSAQPGEEPTMTPFSLSELGLTEEEIAALGLSEAEAAPPAPAEVAPPEAEAEPAMTPFSLSELGLTEEEIAALGLGGEEPPAAPSGQPMGLAPAEAPPSAEAAPPETEAEAETEPIMTPVSLSELGLTEEEIAALDQGTPGEAPGAAEEVVAPEPVEAPDLALPATPPSAPVEAPAPAPSTEAPSGPAQARPERAPAGPPPDDNEVLNAFLRRLEVEPQNNLLRLSIARLGGQIGRTDFALQQYRQLIKQQALLDQVVDDLNDLIADIDDRQVLQRLHRLLGDAYARQGRFNEAIEEYSWTPARA